MKKPPSVEAVPPLVLDAATAADLMTPNPVWIRPDATLKEAAVLLADKRVSAAPVLDELGRPLGVLSKSDIVAHCREMVEFLSVTADYDAREDLRDLATGLRKGLAVVDVDRTPVRDLMMPTIFSVAPDAPAHQVVDELLARRLHRLFVVSREGILLGVISTVDVLRHLQREMPHVHSRGSRPCEPQVSAACDSTPRASLRRAL